MKTTISILLSVLAVGFYIHFQKPILKKYPVPARPYLDSPYCPPSYPASRPYLAHRPQYCPPPSHGPQYYPPPPPVPRYYAPPDCSPRVPQYFPESSPESALAFAKNQVGILRDFGQGKSIKNVSPGYLIDCAEEAIERAKVKADTSDLEREMPALKKAAWDFYARRRVQKLRDYNSKENVLPFSIVADFARDAIEESRKAGNDVAQIVEAWKEAVEAFFIANARESLGSKQILENNPFTAL